MQLTSNMTRIPFRFATFEIGWARSTATSPNAGTRMGPMTPVKQLIHVSAKKRSYTQSQSVVGHRPSRTWVSAPLSGRATS